MKSGVALRLPPHSISGLTDSFNRTRLRSAVWPCGCLISNIEPMEIPGRLLLLCRQRLLFSHASTEPTENSACRRLLLLILLLICPLSSLLAENWPCWRGPRQDGTSIETNVPIHWSATSNVVWKTELPGFGHASPIVHGDHIFTVSAVNESQGRLLLCLDRKSGKI